MRRILTPLILVLIISLFMAPVYALGHRIHRVSSGESLFVISRDHGVTIDEIAKLNNLRTSIIHPKQVLIIPNNKLATYTVVKGDTLFLISQRLGVTMDS